jgi:phosphomevalonate kinase
VTRTIRAPGKLFWLGEYVVLDGAPAIVAAVDRELLVHVDKLDGAEVLVESELWGDPVRFALDGTPIGDVPRAARLVAHVVELAAESSTLGARRLRIDGGRLADGAKLGLGSSGATAAAVAAALLGDGVSDAVVEFVAMQAHHRWQGNVGSGADVLASLHGGLLVIRDGGVVAHPSPAGALEVVVLHTGRPADTRELVAQYRAALESEDGGRGAAALRLAAEQGATALVAGDLPGFVDAVADFAEVERRFGVVGVDIVTPPIERAMELAADCGFVAKPSGAGGGDCVVAFGTRGADRARFEALARAVGLAPIGLALSDSGALRSRRS